MTRICTLIVAVLIVGASRASAHFVFVVPEPGGAKVRVVMSEDLKPDADVDVSIIAGAKLVVREVPGGRETPVTLAKAGDALAAEIAGGGTRLVHGVADLGVKQRGEGKPFLLVYHPKTIVGDAFDPRATLGEKTPVEIVPVGKAGALRFRVLIGGKPATAGAEVNLVLPDGKQRKVAVDAEGMTPAMESTGRYGAWARHFEAAAGERDGKRYEQVRHYATLVVDVGGEASAAARAAIELPKGVAFAKLPEATSSFGAVAGDGWLYVYGGHVVKTHTYHTAAVSGRFHRLNLADGKTWEELPGGPELQGMNLAAYDGKIYRVGGMTCLNKPGEKADNHSVADVARYDPSTKKWEALAPLPQPRSSHDVAVIDGKLVVLGGWNMRGKAGNDWQGTTLVLDLTAAGGEWRSIKQPFERRALIAAVHQEKVWAIGGFDEESDPSLRVDVLDVRAGTWAAGPALPGPEKNGFAPAACVVGGRLYVSVGDGGLHRLNEAGAAWEKVATTTPRIVHRLAPRGGEQVLVMGGAMKGENFDLVEAVGVK